MSAPSTAIDPTALAAEYGTPFYLYNLDRVGRAAEDLLATLPRPATLLYSLKANPHPDLVRAFLAAGCQAEVSSSGELVAALDAGCDAEQCFYTGPGKTGEEIGEAIDAGVGTFSAESPTDLRRIAGVARSRNLVVDCVLRVNGREAGGGAGMRMTGEASQFGTDVDLLLDRADELRGPAVDGVRLVGFHFYPLTNAAGEDVLATELCASIATAADLARRLGITVSVLDLGGGFACPFASAGERPTYPGLRSLVEAALDEHFPGWRAGATRVLFESGRHLVGDCGTLVGTVNDVKLSRGTRFAVLDTGINHLGGLSGIGRLLPLSAAPASLPGADAALEPGVGGGAMSPTRLVGPLCTPADTLGRGSTELPELHVGQLLAIPNVGAYGATASLVGFLSRPGAAELVVRDGQIVSASRLALSREPVRRRGPSVHAEPLAAPANGVIGYPASVATGDLVEAAGGPAAGGPWDGRFLPIVRSVLPRMRPDEDVAQASLRAAGLDSLALVELLVRLEEAYGVSIPDDVLDTDSFATPAALWVIVSGALDSSRDPL